MSSFVSSIFLSYNPGIVPGNYGFNGVGFTVEKMYNLPSIDAEDGGFYKVDGYVTYDDAPASRKVRLSCLDSGRVIRETWSDPVTGYYIFDRIKNQAYYVWSEDYLRVFDPISHLVTNNPI